MIRYDQQPEPCCTEHEAFQDAVLGKEADIVTLQQGRTTVRVAEAVIQSAAEDRTIKVARESAES